MCVHSLTHTTHINMKYYTQCYYSAGASSKSIDFDRFHTQCTPVDHNMLLPTQFYYSTQNMQICVESITLPTIFDDIPNEINFKMKGVGRGRTKNGVKKTWRKKFYFEKDLLTLRLNNLGAKEFKNAFGGTSADDVKAFWQAIRRECIRPKETEIHARNKLLLWLDKLHNSLSWKSIKKEYKIGSSTAVGYMQDVMNGIINAFKNTNIITFPTETQRLKMVEMLKKKGAQMPHVLFTLDGKHSLCTGRNRRERRSIKYRWLPCFNVMFVVERLFGTVCAFNLDAAAIKHDITVLRESTFFQNIDEIMDGWIVIADKGYVGTKNHQIAAAMKRPDARRKWYSKRFWKLFNGARGDSERVFAHFFYNKFTQLSHWPGKGDDAFIRWSKNVACCIMMYNFVKLRNADLL